MRRYFEKYPKMVLFEITTRCNLKCSYCTARSLIKHPSDLPIENIKALKDKLAAFEYVALCGMGESLMHKDFYEVIEILKENRIVLITNGSVPINYEKLMKYKNVESISFSADRASEEEMKLISSNYKIDILYENLKNAMDHDIEVAFNCTLVPGNLEKLIDLSYFAMKYQVDIFKVGLPIGQSKWVRENFDEIMKRLIELEEKVRGFNIKFEGPFEKKCTHEDAPIAVMSRNGNVYPCCDYYCGRPLAGNLYNNEFKDMWEGKAYDSFRSGKYCRTCKQYHNFTDLSEKFYKEQNIGYCLN